MYQDRRDMTRQNQYRGRYPRQGMAEEKAVEQVEEITEEVNLQAEECGCDEDCGCDCGCEDDCGCKDGCGGNNMMWLVLLWLLWR